VCRSVVATDWPRCYQCNQALKQLPVTADVVAPLAIAVKHEQLARELWVYKYRSEPLVRRKLTLGLAAVLWRFLEVHEVHIAEAVNLDADDFGIVSCVPSTTGRVGEHPLRLIVSNIRVTRDRYRDLLVVNEEVTQERRFDANRWKVTEPLVEGAAILLIDDTWTTGSRTQSAAAALRSAGAAKVAAVLMGRHFNREPPEPYRQDAERYYRMVHGLSWDWDLCCIDRDR
jgi:hypothetical protein